LNIVGPWVYLLAGIFEVQHRKRKIGHWNPEPGTIYKALFDQCRAVFGVQALCPASSAACYGDPIGVACRCNWIADDFDVSILTPQVYGGNRFPRNRADLERWLAGERVWKRTTGFLRVLRAVSSPQCLPWVAPAAIALGFALELPSVSIQEGQQALKNMISCNEWFSTQLRRYGDYDLMLTFETDPRAMRGTLLIQTAKLQIVVGEAIGQMGLANFDRFVGYPLRGAPLEGEQGRAVGWARGHAMI
jgi:hypothetical protein